MGQGLIAELPTTELQSVIERADLPSLPSAVLRIMHVSADPSGTLAQVAAAVGTDPVLAARVLGMANSVFYNRGTSFERVDRAVAHLGIMQIRSLALGLHLVALRPDVKDGGFDHGYFWRRALTSATAAKLIARLQRIADPEEAFVTALLEDIGVLAIQRAHPVEYGALFREKARRGLKLHEAEARQWGWDHADIGAALLERWEVPGELVECVRTHHAAEAGDVAQLCAMGDAVHDVIFRETAEARSRLAGGMKGRIGDEIRVLQAMETELPHICRACACPGWDHGVESEVKSRIRELLEVEQAAD